MELEFLEAKSEFMKEIVMCDVEYVQENLSDGETLHGLSVGVFQEEYGLYAITSERLIFCATANKDGLLREYPIEQIEDMTLQSTGLYNIRMNVGGSFYRLGLSWEVAKEFHALCSGLIHSEAELDQAA